MRDAPLSMRETEYSDDRKSLGQEIREALRTYGAKWVPETDGPDLITAIARALEDTAALRAQLQQARDAKQSAGDSYERLDAVYGETLANLQQAEERARRWSLALQSVTPGGSEYVGDPERCVAFVRDARNSAMETIKRFKRRADVAESKLAEITLNRDGLANCLRRALVEKQAAEEQRSKLLYRLEGLAAAVRRIEHYARFEGDPHDTHEQMLLIRESAAHQLHLVDEYRKADANAQADTRAVQVEPVVSAVAEDQAYLSLHHDAPAHDPIHDVMDSCAWPDCHEPALCTSGNFGGRLVCREHLRLTNGVSPVEPDPVHDVRADFAPAGGGEGGL